MTVAPLYLLFFDGHDPLSIRPSMPDLNPLLPHGSCVPLVGHINALVFQASPVVEVLPAHRLGDRLLAVLSWSFAALANTASYRVG